MNKRTFSVLWCCVVCIGTWLPTFATLPVQWNIDALCRVPQVDALPTLDTLGVHAILVHSIDYKGEPTRFFAYYALPQGADASHRVPAMVLVHGGGGSAFWQWVKAWTERGYAAIALDTTGKLPIRVPGDPFGQTFANWTPLMDGLHLEWGDFDRGLREPEEQWTYGAVSQIMLAHSFIRSLPEVDSEHTAITGNSWGGFLTLVTAAVDKRFAFAAPVYGCGFYDEFSAQTSTKQRLGEAWRRWVALWDPKHYIPEIQMPLVWAAGTNDFFFDFGALQQSFRLAKVPTYKAVRHHMIHTDGASPDGRPAETFAMADCMFRQGKPLPMVQAPVLKGRKATVEFTAEGREVASLQLFYTTTSEGTWQKRKWTIQDLPMPRGQKVRFNLPADVYTFFVNLCTTDGLVASSEAVTLDKP